MAAGEAACLGLSGDPSGDVDWAACMGLSRDPSSDVGWAAGMGLSGDSFGDVGWAACMGLSGADSFGDLGWAARAAACFSRCAAARARSSWTTEGAWSRGFTPSACSGMLAGWAVDWAVGWAVGWAAGLSWSGSVLPTCGRVWLDTGRTAWPEEAAAAAALGAAGEAGASGPASAQRVPAAAALGPGATVWEWSFDVLGPGAEGSAAWLGVMGVATGTSSYEAKTEHLDQSLRCSQMQAAVAV